jgi:hypothetical protein
MSWLYLAYEPVSAFALRPSNSTSTGGKSLIAPTPYAIKMGMLDRLIRNAGIEAGELAFPVIRDLQIYMSLPKAIAVNRTFQKVLRKYDNKTQSWTNTIVQIEFCIFAGILNLAMPAPPEPMLLDLMKTATSINYFGKRGGFMQLIDHQVSNDAPNDAFVNCSVPTTDLQFGFLQRMDDMLPDATFEDISIFNPKAKGSRNTYTVIFPHQLAYHGTNHTVYDI